MANNVKKQSRPRWTQSEIQSLTLWYNQGVSLEEIASRLNRTHASVAGILSNRRNQMDLVQFRRGRTSVPVPQVNAAVDERRKSTRIILSDVAKNEHITVIKAITQVGKATFQARLLMTKNDLTGYRGISMAEFTSVDACHRWFEKEIESWRFD